MIQYCSKIEVSSDILNWWQNRLCAGISLVPGKGNKKMNSIKEKRNLGTKNKTKMALLWPYLTYTGLNAETRLVFFFFFLHLLFQTSHHDQHEDQAFFSMWYFSTLSDKAPNLWQAQSSITSYSDQLLFLDLWGSAFLACTIWCYFHCMET